MSLYQQFVNLFNGTTKTNTVLKNLDNEFKKIYTDINNIMAANGHGHTGNGSDGAKIALSSVIGLTDSTGTIKPLDVIIRGSIVDVRAYGAIGDGVTDDTVAIQAAIDAAAYKTLVLRGGSYLVTGQLQIQYPMAWIGHQEDGKILVDSSVSNTTDVILINPAGVDTKSYTFRDLYVYPKSGTPGRDLLRIVTSSTHFVANIEVSGCDFRAMGGTGCYGINLVNNTPVNPNGIPFLVVNNNIIYGGIKANNLGDSCYIEKNSIKGNNRGIDITMVNDVNGTAAQLNIKENNIVNNLGAINLDSCRQFNIVDNNIEQIVAFGGNLVEISNTANNQFSIVSGNKIEPATPTSRTGGIRLTNASYVKIDNNHIATSAVLDAESNIIGTTTGIEFVDCNNITVTKDNHVYVSRGCTGIKIDTLSSGIDVTSVVPVLYGSSGTETSISDAGVGTIGVIKSATTTWVAYQSYCSPLQFCKQGNIVHLRGDIKAADAATTINNGTVLTTLPIGFRPPKNVEMDIKWCNTGGTFSRAAISIISTGEIVINETLTSFLYLSLGNVGFMVD